MGGYTVDECHFEQLDMTSPEYIVRVGDFIDVVSASWMSEVQSPGILDVAVRWVVNSPYDELTAYLALRDSSGLIWAAGSTKL
ncbi:MAG: hypothetical protein P1S60_17505, partial [Anaerolineae bacterium]|nr:hypothetical protein [Anaerolineae bacterium]